MKAKTFGYASVAATAACLAGVIIGSQIGFAVIVVGGFALMGCAAAFSTLKMYAHA